MRASIAIIAAVAGLAAAVPSYGYGEYQPEPVSSAVVEPSTTAPGYGSYPAPSSVPGYGEAPAPSSVEEGYTPGYPAASSTEEVSYPTETYPGEVPSETYPGEVPSETATYPGEVPSETATYPGEVPSETEGYPAPSETATYPGEVPSESVTVPAPTAPYPTGGVPTAPYPTGTGAPVPPPAGTASSGYVKPSSPPESPEFTGAASHAKVGGFVAGVGAFAAFFL